MTTIRLGLPSPRGSSDRPGDIGRAALNRPLFDLAPDGVCRARTVTDPAVGSYSTLSPSPLKKSGSLLSVALSSKFPPPGVTRHLALWSPDFPPGRAKIHTSRRPSDPLIRDLDTTSQPVSQR